MARQPARRKRDAIILKDNVQKNFLWSEISLAFVLGLIIVVSFAILNPPLVIASTTNVVNSETATVSIPSTCVPILSNTLITFPSTQAGLSQPTSNDENVMNYGNAQANILVDGGNWISGSFSFLPSNTLWNPSKSAVTPPVGTQLTNSVTGADTRIPIQENGGSNDVFFGLNIPAGQSAGTYAETINLLLSC